ncbi:MAG: hypothetical protein IPP71_09235 [Bacteroidetes bacterium]|nr:hypothetical protein [Bacteroidota bacterium]
MVTLSLVVAGIRNVIVPNPSDDSSYYVFSIGVTFQFGLMYSIVDMQGDGGLGAVTQKMSNFSNF